MHARLRATPAGCDYTPFSSCSPSPSATAAACRTLRYRSDRYKWPFLASSAAATALMAIRRSGVQRAMRCGNATVGRHRFRISKRCLIVARVLSRDLFRRTAPRIGTGVRGNRKSANRLRPLYAIHVGIGFAIAAVHRTRIDRARNDGVERRHTGSPDVNALCS